MITLMPLGLSFASFSFWNWKLSRNAKLLLGLLAGLSLSILATGYLLSKRRRRYRAISTTSSDNASSLRRTSTFRTTENPTPFHSMARSHDVELSNKYPSPLSPGSDSSTCVSETSVLEEEGEDTFTNIIPYSQSGDFSDGAGHDSVQLSSRLSESSDDSFHSTVEHIDISVDPLQRNHFYLTAMEQVKHGLVHCRKLRANTLMCKSDADFLAKLFCVRLAFDELMESQANKNYFKQMGRDIMSSFLRSTNQDPALFCERYDSLNQFLEGEGNWTIAERELRDRKVVCMNVYDIAMDFVLLDAFDDLDNPPSTVVAVLQNRWITDGMKKSALSAAIWSLLKAKKSMLRSKGGFMAHFYLLCETISPTLAWGFLGTDTTLKEQCLQFRAHVLEFVCDIFSLDSVRYTTVHTLADDILLLAQHTAQSLIVE